MDPKVGDVLFRVPSDKVDIQPWRVVSASDETTIGDDGKVTTTRRLVLKDIAGKKRDLDSFDDDGGQWCVTLGDACHMLSEQFSEFLDKMKKKIDTTLTKEGWMATPIQQDGTSQQAPAKQIRLVQPQQEDGYQLVELPDGTFARMRV